MYEYYRDVLVSPYLTATSHIFYQVPVKSVSCYGRNMKKPFIFMIWSSLTWLILDCFYLLFSISIPWKLITRQYMTAERLCYS